MQLLYVLCITHLRVSPGPLAAGRVTEKRASCHDGGSVAVADGGGAAAEVAWWPSAELSAEEHGRHQLPQLCLWLAREGEDTCGANQASACSWRTREGAKRGAAPSRRYQKNNTQSTCSAVRCAQRQRRMP